LLILRITARQYGEVVLPDASTGQGLGTLARKLSRCKEGMAHFLLSGYKFSEVYECRVTRLIGAANLSPVTKSMAGTGAVSRYKLSRSQKLVTVQDFNSGQMRALPDEALRSRVSGCNNHYKFVLSAVAKAKSVTNNLPILSVLLLVLFYFLNQVDFLGLDLFVVFLFGSTPEITTTSVS